MCLNAQYVCVVCCLLEDEKCQNVSLLKLMKVIKQQIHDTRTFLSADLMNVEQQQPQSAGN